MIKIIRSPEETTSYVNIHQANNFLFLAGGITDCPNWQEDLSKDIFDNHQELDLVIINPRREGDLARNGKEAIEQIKWENKYLEVSFSYLFWFPKEGLCQITLFELGKYAQKIKDKYESNQYFRYGHSNRLFVGVEPGYIRQVDVETQLKLIFSDIKISYSLDELKDRIINNFKEENKFPRLFKNT